MLPKDDDSSDVKEVDGVFTIVPVVILHTINRDFLRTEFYLIMKINRCLTKNQVCCFICFTTSS